MSETTKSEAVAEATVIRTMNIWQKLAAITAELKVVAKNLDVPTGGKNSYKAVSERDIIDAVKPLEAKYGIYSYPSERLILESEMLVAEKTDYHGNLVKTTTFFTRMQTTYTFVNVDNPDEKVTTTVFSVGMDTQDKGEGKAMTYGDKYALMKMYKISTGDDPDQDPSENQEYSRSKQTPGNGRQPQYQAPPQQNPGYAQPQYQAPPQQNSGQPQSGGRSSKPIYCTDCNTVIDAQVAAYSYKNLGRFLCRNCQQQARAAQGGQR